MSLPGADIEVSALCLGAAEIGVRQTEIKALGLLDSWVQRGGNAIDAARVYFDWIHGEKHRSERIVLAMKAGDPLLENKSRVSLGRSLLARARLLRKLWHRFY